MSLDQQTNNSSFYRSDSVVHYNLILPRQSAWDIMNKLGQANIIHIVSSANPILSKPFFNQVKRCEQALQKLDVVEKILYQKQKCIENEYLNKQNWEQDFQQLYKIWEQESTQARKNPISMLDEFQQKIMNISTYYSGLNQRMENLKQKIDFNRQNTAIIKGAEKNYGRGFFTNSQQRLDQIGQVFMKDISKVSFKAGVIDAVDQIRFKRTIFRITKGNCLINTLHFDQIFQSLQECQQTKMVFFVLFPAKQDGYLDKKITKLVNTYCQKKYQFPSKSQEFQPLIRSLQQSYIETQKLLSLTQSQIDQYLAVLASPAKQIRTFKTFQYLKLYILKERQLYSNLNQMELFNNFLKGQIYIRKDDISDLHRLLQAIQKIMKIPSGQIIATQSKKYPTYFARNSFTSSAQQIVQTYGVPRYKQANPGFFTLVTFPFLFGVMFGDIAHGSILFAFGIYLCFQKSSITNFVFKMFIPHRYLITMMGFFAVYCGFVYNDFMSISLDLFGSCYDLQHARQDQPVKRFSTQCVYSFGIDPIWAVASNTLNYTNSLKMKLSVIIAVIHMTLGVFVKASNALHYKKYMDFFFQFVPQLFFMTALFAYMDFLIFYKWFIPYNYVTVSQAPSIITTMINIPLKLGKTTDCCGGQPLWGTPGDTSQDSIQLVLLIIAVICIPLMLLPKPLYEIYCAPHPSSKNKKNKYAQVPANSKDKSYKSLISQQEVSLDKRDSQISSASSENIVDQEEQHDASEIFVHQMIQTIQYVLGCISNTASYLRLWALSLAHSQLSDVFLQKTVEGGISSNYSGIPMMIIGFPILAGVTFGVLLCMDSMECFLHTLRLHWVEFQNKFYKGDGFIFTDFNFTKAISGAGGSGI